jgi:hypothetical protein
MALRRDDGRGYAIMSCKPLDHKADELRRYMRMSCTRAGEHV